VLQGAATEELKQAKKKGEVLKRRRDGQAKGHVTIRHTAYRESDAILRRCRGTGSVLTRRHGQPNQGVKEEERTKQQG